MIALQAFNKFVIQYDSSLYAFSLDILARVAQGQAPAQSLEASMEKLAEQDGSVQFTRAGRIGDRTLRECLLRRDSNLYNRSDSCVFGFYLF